MQAEEHDKASGLPSKCKQHRQFDAVVFTNSLIVSMTNSKGAHTILELAQQQQGAEDVIELLLEALGRAAKNRSHN